ncbi:MAG: ABC transporter substrate-binding protein [Erysipelotrichaceae bacterium]|nr:ABC transporter substrate-binding protein [Erysipelotrichaceae bacterium]
MKKLFVLLITVLLALTALSGCEKKPEPEKKDPSVIRLDMSTLWTPPNLEDVQKVEDAINKYLKETLHEEGYVLDLVITSIGEYLQKIPMELASGADDTADIVQVFGMAQWVENGYLQNLDPYIDKELKPSMDLIGNIAGSGKLDGHYYMIPRFFGTVLDWKFIYNKEMVDAAGVDVTRAHDLDSLGDVLADLKKAYPDEYFLVYCDQFPSIYSYQLDVSQVGTYAATVGESTTLVNYYETEAFKKAIYKAYEFRQKGYADPEGSMNTSSHDNVVMSGRSKGVIMGHSAEPEGIAKMFTKTADYGDGKTHEFGAVTIGIGDLYTDTLGIGIAHKCKDPAAAARFINLLYTDEFVWNSLMYGAEGVHYIWNADHTKVTYPEGMNFNNAPYNCIYSCGMIGNGLQMWGQDGSDESGSNPNYGKELMQTAWCPPLYGFTPVTANVMDELSAISNVVDTYLKSLTFGDENPDELYPKFLKELKDAGIDKVIAEYQKQADEWIKQNK